VNLVVHSVKINLQCVSKLLGSVLHLSSDHTLASNIPTVVYLFAGHSSVCVFLANFFDVLMLKILLVKLQAQIIKGEQYMQTLD